MVIVVFAVIVVFGVWQERHRQTQPRRFPFDANCGFEVLFDGCPSSASDWAQLTKCIPGCGLRPCPSSDTETTPGSHRELLSGRKELAAHSELRKLWMGRHRVKFQYVET